MSRTFITVATLFLLADTAMAQVAMVPGDRFRAWTKPGVDLKAFHSYYVVKEADDDRGIDSFIVDALAQLDLETHGGELQGMPTGTDVEVTYESFYSESSRAAGVTDLLIFYRDPSTSTLLALTEMEKVQTLPGPETITAAVHYLLGPGAAPATPPLPSDLTKPYKAKSKNPEGSIPAFTARGQIRIVNAEPSARWPIVYPLRLVMKKEYVDRQQLLEVAKAALEERIREAGGAIVSEGADKTITLAVTDLSMIAIFETFINFTLETGDGYIRGLQAHGKQWNYRTSIDEAVADIPVQILNDPNVLKYLEQ